MKKLVAVLCALAMLCVSFCALAETQAVTYESRGIEVHATLVTPDGAEIGIQTVPAVFALIGRIQEETHRFAITYHRTLRSKRVKGSQLDEIPGIGEKRRLALLKRFGSLTAIREASVEQLSTLLPAPTAKAVYDHFHPQE